jgi:hypothetical protein
MPLVRCRIQDLTLLWSATGMHAVNLSIVLVVTFVGSKDIVNGHEEKPIARFEN